MKLLKPVSPGMVLTKCYVIIEIGQLELLYTEGTEK